MQTLIDISDRLLKSTTDTFTRYLYDNISWDESLKVGGRNKTGEQIKNIENAFVVADDIESGFQNKIPLWMFGMLY